MAAKGWRCCAPAVGLTRHPSEGAGEYRGIPGVILLTANWFLQSRTCMGSRQDSTISPTAEGQHRFP